MSTVLQGQEEIRKKMQQVEQRVDVIRAQQAEHQAACNDLNSARLLASTSMPMIAPEQAATKRVSFEDVRNIVASGTSLPGIQQIDDTPILGAATNWTQTEAPKKVLFALFLFFCSPHSL